jgi:hypothetical protein
MQKISSKITGHLDIFIAQNEDELDSVITKWQNILIHGDPEGLRSLATILLKLADTDQNDIVDLPIGAREHIHLRPKNGSKNVQSGRLFKLIFN